MSALKYASTKYLNRMSTYQFWGGWLNSEGTLPLSLWNSATTAVDFAAFTTTLDSESDQCSLLFMPAKQFRYFALLTLISLKIQ